MTEPQVEAPESAACRVAWEVAGVRGDLKKKVGTFTEAGKKGKINAYNWMYEMEIYKMEDSWPEQDRKRVWVSSPSFISKSLEDGSHFACCALLTRVSIRFHTKTLCVPQLIDLSLN